MKVSDGGQLHTESGTVVTIGKFDGVHLGHRRILTELKKRAEENGLSSLIYTFSQHPMQVLKGDLPLINDREKKISLAEECGIDYLYFADFLQIKDLQPEQFVKEILMKQLGMKVAVIGENNRFGKNSSGDAALLKSLGEKYGFLVYVVPTLRIEDTVCSSSVIREMLEVGDVSGAAQLLGRRFSLRGTVIKGKQLGRTYGFPTANIAPDESQLLPKYGVYATDTIVDGISYPSITNVGETSFDRKKIIRAETHIIGLEADLYGKDITVEFVHFMRDIFHFDTTDNLLEQLKKDRKCRLQDMEEKL